MRTRIVHEGAKHLEYEIRQIVDYGYQLRDRFGIEMTWENIGDPLAMGETIPVWMREVVEKLVMDTRSWAYCPSRGVPEAREYLASEVNRRPGGVKVTPNDILFTNGVADAVDKIYDLVRRDARILMQAPSYPTHSSNEGKRGDYSLLQFNLDPDNEWQPNIEEIENKVKYNPQIIAIALVNPDNPTGMVYKPEILTQIVDIARRYGLFIICDEIYVHIVYNGREVCHLSQLIGDVPALALRGISKDYPWPGSRCGWIEMLNRTSDSRFNEYCDALVNAKMMEVCSTTLPQMSIPKVYGHPEYPKHMKARSAMFESRANEFYDFFQTVPGTRVTRPQGSFYFTVLFNGSMIDPGKTLPIANPEARTFVENKAQGVAPDKRFMYYLMASEGICATPLSGFQTKLNGFRLTVLRPDAAKRMDTLNRLKKAIVAYQAS